MRGSPFIIASVVATLAIACSNDDAREVRAWMVDAGALKLVVEESPWRMRFFDAAGTELLS